MIVCQPEAVAVTGPLWCPFCLTTTARGLLVAVVTVDYRCWLLRRLLPRHPRIVDTTTRYTCSRCDAYWDDGATTVM